MGFLLLGCGFFFFKWTPCFFLIYFFFVLLLWPKECLKHFIVVFFSFAYFVFTVEFFTLEKQISNLLLSTCHLQKHLWVSGSTAWCYLSGNKADLKTSFLSCSSSLPSQQGWCNWSLGYNDVISLVLHHSLAEGCIAHLMRQRRMEGISFMGAPARENGTLKQCLSATCLLLIFFQETVLSP